MVWVRNGILLNEAVSEHPTHTSPKPLDGTVSVILKASTTVQLVVIILLGVKSWSKRTT